MAKQQETLVSDRRHLRGFLEDRRNLSYVMRTRSVERTLEELAAATHCDGAECDEADTYVTENSAFATGVGETAATSTATCSVAAACCSTVTSDDVERTPAVWAGWCWWMVREWTWVNLSVGTGAENGAAVATARGNRTQDAGLLSIGIVGESKS